MGLKDVQLIDVTGQENLGVSGGRNLGIRHSTGEYLFFIDDDVAVDSNSLTELTRIAESDPSIGIIGPLMYRYDLPSKVWFYNSYISQDSDEEIVDVPLVVGAALFIKREVIRKIGLFDEIYFLYHEEWDLCYRAQKAGYRTVCATKVRSWHKVPIDESSKLLEPKRAYYWHRNMFIFAGRHEKTMSGALRFLFRQLIYFGPKSIPGFYGIIALRNGKLDALKSYFQGILHGIVYFAILFYTD
jgi:GT2 family glycosyltransferase